MCGRFTLMASWEEVVAYMSLLDVEPFPPRYNIAPTQPILMVIAGAPHRAGSNLPERSAMLVRWGLIPGWAKDPGACPCCSMPAPRRRASGPPSERRCGTAAHWSRRAASMNGRRSADRRKPYFLRPRGGGLVAFAGLMETYADPNGSEIDTGAILTTEASPDIADIHHRMPVVVRPEDFSRWLDCRRLEPREVADILRPPEPGLFEAIPVSGLVNNVANVGPEIQEPVPAESPRPTSSG